MAFREGAIEIDDMEPLGALSGELLGHFHRIAVIASNVLPATTSQAYAAALAQIDSGNNQHSHRLKRHRTQFVCGTRISSLCVSVRPLCFRGEFLPNHFHHRDTEVSPRHREEPGCSSVLP